VLEDAMVSCQNPVLLFDSAQGLLCYAVNGVVDLDAI